MTYGDYPDLSGVKKVLVIKLRHLGDVLLATPVFEGLAQFLPHAKIDAYVYEEAKPILEGHRAISDLIGYDRLVKKKGFFSSLMYELRLLLKIRREGYDLVLNLTEGDRGVLAAWVSKAKIRVGFSPKGRFQKKVITHVVKSTPGLRHTVERNLDVLRRIGLFPKEEDRELSFFVEDSVVDSIRKKMGVHPFTLIHPASRWKFKCWPVDKMRSLVSLLLARGERVVLISGPDSEEKKMVDAIAQGLNVEILSGQMTLKELGALISMTKQLVCVDSVALHIASAFKAPVVALFGPTSDVTWGPWRNPKARIVAQNFSCRPCYQDGCGGSKYADCLQTLSVTKVLSAIDDLSIH